MNVKRCNTISDISISTKNSMEEICDVDGTDNEDLSS
jgi:hypothetical protein